MNLQTFGFLCSALLILSLASPSPAQITFQRTYGGRYDDGGHSVAQTADGGYIVAGCTQSFSTYNYGAWLIKTDANGDTVWTRAFGGERNDWGYSVAQTADGGYVVGGYTNSYSAGDNDFWLIKTDANGDTMWTRTYGGEGSDRAYSVAQTTDGGYVMTGYTESFGAGRSDVWLIKTNATGDTTWTRTYGGAHWDHGYSVVQTADGDYVIAGRTWFDANGKDVWLIKTDANGDAIWTRTYGGTSSECGYSVAQTVDGGYIVAGDAYSFGAGGNDVWLIKTDANGDTMWTRTYGGPYSDQGYSVAQTTDGGYIVASHAASHGPTGYDVRLIKTDASGDTMWTRTFGGEGGDFGRSVLQTPDGGYAIAGCTSFGAGMADVWLIKTDSAGNSAIAEPEPPVAHKPAPATIVRAVLRVPESTIRHSSFALLNSAGRKVMALHPGENDVRHLSPGIYFVRQASSIRKVILTH